MSDFQGMHFIIGAVLIITGLIISSQGSFTTPTQEFTDSYPMEDGNWFNDDYTTNNVESEDGFLVLNDTDEPGYLETPIVEKQENIQFSNIVYAVNNIRTDGQEQTVQITVEGRDDEESDFAVIDQQTVEPEQDGSVTEQLDNLDRFEGYAAYRMVVDLETESSTSPEVQEINLEGEVFEGGALMSTAIGMLLVFVGLFMMVKEL